MVKRSKTKIVVNGRTIPVDITEVSTKDLFSKQDKKILGKHTNIIPKGFKIIGAKAIVSGIPFLTEAPYRADALSNLRARIKAHLRLFSGRK